LLKVNFTAVFVRVSDGQTTRPAIIASRVTRFCVRIHHAGYTYPQLLEVWQAADTLGFDGASLYDVFNPLAFEVWTTLSALAMAAERLVAIPLVLDVGYRQPAMLAKMAASLDRLTGGQRLILGLGYGGNPDAHRAYGYSWPRRVSDRVARLEEHVVVLRRLWSEGPAWFEGAWYQLAAAQPFPVARPGGPPILVASRGVTFGLAGVARCADLSNVSFDLSPGEWAQYSAILARYASAAGRRAADIGLTHNATVVLGRSRGEANERFDRLARSRNLTSEQARHGLASALVGTPDEVVERLLSYRQAGIDLAWIFLLFSDLPHTDSLRLFAQEVLPAYRAAAS
jgi:alkanesulfonate monooxygenase SsuD/methylene tetrahydromethanopterin reductase-like flavin-dependent oxidoreductase (luciferase family)